jgi:hypothetical protein
VGTSYVDYRGRGFWASDARTELWLSLLHAEAGALASTPRWLAEARTDWGVQATAGFVGCVSPSLDRHLAGEPDREALVLGLAEQVRRQLTEWAPAIPRDVANAFAAGGPGSCFTADVDTSPMLRFADAFIDLLGSRPPLTES